jgi:hypothetical protein
VSSPIAVSTKLLARRTLSVSGARPTGERVGRQEVPVTHLRQAMLEELQRRNSATTTVYYYLKAVEYFHTSPDFGAAALIDCED